MNEKTSQFLRRQADLCIALSRATFDLTLAGRLRVMAEEFRATARQGQGDINDFRSPHSYGNAPKPAAVRP